MSSRNQAETVRIQVSLDYRAAEFLERLAVYGLEGKNKSEVASRIIQNWIVAAGAKKIRELEEIVEIVSDEQQGE